MANSKPSQNSKPNNKGNNASSNRNNSNRNNNKDVKQPKCYESHNMNYIFHVEYFEHLQKWLEGKNEAKLYNKGIENFKFYVESPIAEWKNIEGYRSFSLKTCYPGLLIGTGNPHDISVDAAIKGGFSFDPVTGLPYIPGSSLKGMLRSYFPSGKDQESAKEHKEYIGALLEMIRAKEQGSAAIDVDALEADIFENHDIFFGGYPCEYQGSSLLSMEYITPHNKGKFANPVPISLIKVKPNVSFEFGFIFNDYVENGVVFSAADKLELMKQLILDMGIGAKTNVGFGKFLEKE